VVGAEHYLLELHGLFTVAAPIFDLTGHPMGCLGLISQADFFHVYGLGLVSAGARAIESQRQADYLLEEQNSQLDRLNAILEVNTEGILVWNADRILMHLNAAAAKMIGLPPQALLGRSLDDVISYPMLIREAVERRESLSDVEVTITIGVRTLTCVLSLRFITRNQELDWIVATLRPEKEVRRLVQRQVGAYALMSLDDLPGDSPLMRRMHRLAKSASGAQASILIRGESGTGKNVLASAIHNESPRHDGPFLIFACSSVPGEAVMGELLGYEEGFGSKKPGGRPSKFELASGGTLFFQDIDALPLEAQTVLLNVLDLGIVLRQGGDRPINVDVRVLAASSANMEKLIAQGSFRADLYYRLSAFEITLPPLRERQKDLPLLVERILRRLSRQAGRTLGISVDALDILRRYPWPGNVRELEAVLSRVVIQTPVIGAIEAIHLPDQVRYPQAVSSDGGMVFVAQPLQELERDAMMQTARMCNGNLSEMARLLGIGRTTVWRKLKEYKIDINEYRSNEASRTV
jgi:transcriptional activator for dhaKLM operon